MAIPALFKNRLRLPIIGAPMFLASSPELVIAQCHQGIAGCFPALNARPATTLADWIARIKTALANFDETNPSSPSAPFGVNLILHSSNNRQQQDLDTVVENQVPLVITSVGKPDEVARRVQAYGGLVFHDVTSIEHARKAIECGVDGLVLVCAGAGGHGGTLSPFAFLREVRQFWQGAVALAGTISDGNSIRAAELMGADFAYMGTRFIATQEAAALSEHKTMIVADGSSDIVYTSAFSGISANYLRNSILGCGLDPEQLSSSSDGEQKGGKDDLFANLDTAPPPEQAKAWKEIWAAGQGVGAINDVLSMSELFKRLQQEYFEAVNTPSQFN